MRSESKELAPLADVARTLTGLSLRNALDALSVDFPQSAITERTGAGARLSSIKPAYEIERLNQVFGLCGFGWTFEEGETSKHESPSEKIHVVIVTEVRLSFAYSVDEDVHWTRPVHAYGQGQVYSGMTQGDAHKSAVTDALTKAASMLGVGVSVFKGEQSHNRGGRTQKGNDRTQNGHREGPQKKADRTATPRWLADLSAKAKANNVPAEHRKEWFAACKIDPAKPDKATKEQKDELGALLDLWVADKAARMALGDDTDPPPFPEPVEDTGELVNEKTLAKLYKAGEDNAGLETTKDLFLAVKMFAKVKDLEKLEDLTQAQAELALDKLGGQGVE